MVARSTPSSLPYCSQTSPNYSPDGTRIAFQSDRTGKNEIWVSDSDGSNALQLSSFGFATTGTPRWSFDGKLIAFDSRVGGESNIYLVDPVGGLPRKLNVDVKGNNLPSWSHDGAWIYFINGDEDHHPAVWKVPSGGRPCGANHSGRSDVPGRVSRREIRLLLARLVAMASGD